MGVTDSLAAGGVLSAKGALQLQPRATPWVHRSTTGQPCKGESIAAAIDAPFQGLASWGVVTQGVALGWS
jgi:hypothetical protein